MHYDFVKVGPGYYRKDNPELGIRTELIYDHNNKTVKVRHLQRVDTVLDYNAHQRSLNHKASTDGMRHVARIPMVEYQRILKECGHTPGHGYDQDKFRKILNSSDYKNLKTTDQRI